jgi:lycopene cyclase domain-containing protein
VNERYLYLALDLGSFVFPFVFSFYTKAKFYKEWKYAVPAILMVAVIFIVWDEWFTQMGVWGFNQRYLTGIYAGSLPLEELLFFFCIPYACVFTYFALNHVVKKDYLKPYERTISHALVAILITSGLIFIDHWYTSVTFLSLAMFLIWLLYYWKPEYMGRFYFAYLIVLIPFFLVNGILTGSWIEEEVVWYNNHENLGIRLGTVPIDDLGYNMLMLLLSITIYEHLKKRKRFN